MAWSKKLTQLNDTLGELIPYQEGIVKYVNDAGLKPQMIRFQGNALDIWSNVINEADKNNKVDDLVASVLKQYPDNPYLLTALNKQEINYTLSPDLDDVSEWKDIEQDTLEKLTSGVSTLLPISFLERGILSSRSVAKIEINIGGVKDVGTGFLFNTEYEDEVFFMTNFHVINDKSQFKDTRIIFNYEEDVDGNSEASKSFKIDHNGPFYTSEVKELDVSIFKLKCSESDLKKYGVITLREIKIKKNNFVNIIQHPAGQMKKISLYHNIVTNTTDRVVQYLTDTLRGSSGAPVFNSNWDVVALHHSGGRRKPTEPKLPQGFKSRNEGIQINRIIEFFNKSRIITEN